MLICVVCIGLSALSRCLPMGDFLAGGGLGVLTVLVVNDVGY